MKHTPGPWKVDEATKNTLTVVAPWSSVVRPENTAVFGDYRGGHICLMHYNSGVPTKEQAEANAKLIAAAPDLLAVVEELDNLISGPFDDPVIQEDFYIRIQNAIKKATE